MSLLYRFERLCVGIRHSALLKQAAPLWKVLRPIYNGVINCVGHRGLVRHLNGTDTIRLCPECRGTGETYEPEVWTKVMGHLKSGSRVIDVGAHVGLYATAFGLRVGATGKVLAIEPDPDNLERLHKHISLNGLQGIVNVVPVAVSDVPGRASLSMDSLQSHVSDTGSIIIKLETLDVVTEGEKWDLLLIDVEGYEEKVLRGGRKLLGDALRRPSMIIIEVHPYAWPDVGTTAESLLGELQSQGYKVCWLDGQEVRDIKAYGHVVAIKK